MVARFQGFDVDTRPDGFRVEIRINTDTIAEALTLAREYLQSYPVDAREAQTEEARSEWRDAVERSKSTGPEEPPAAPMDYEDEERRAIVEESENSARDTEEAGGLSPVYQEGGLFEGKKITKTKTADGVAFLLLEDGTKVKIDLSTLSEIARKIPEGSSDSWEAQVREASTLRGAVSIVVEHAEDALSWCVTNREDVPTFARINPKTFRARIERQIHTLGGGS